jgi:hypothetical protein
MLCTRPAVHYRVATSTLENPFSLLNAIYGGLNLNQRIDGPEFSYQHEGGEILMKC